MVIFRLLHYPLLDLSNMEPSTVRLHSGSSLCNVRPFLKHARLGGEISRVDVEEVGLTKPCRGVLIWRARARDSQSKHSLILGSAFIPCVDVRHANGAKKRLCGPT